MFHISNIKLRWYGHLGYSGDIQLKPGANLVIGKNGSGKTSLLKMIDGLSRDAHVGLDPEAQASYPNQGDELVKVSYTDEKGDGSTTSYRRRNSEGAWDVFQMFNRRVRLITSDRRVNMSSAANNPIPTINRDIAIPDPGAEIDISLEFTNAILKDLAASIEKYATTTNILNELKTSYTSGLVDFDKQIQIDLKRPQNPIYFTDHRGREVAINDLSSGEKEYLYFYALLKRMGDEQDKIILVDEPELHLHSSQLKKLCEMIEGISAKNQVIIATHSGEILQSFINSNLILLNEGSVTNVATTTDLKAALDNMGLPVDPSIFTSTWICAENDPEKPLHGAGAPKTPTVLEWVFGKGLKTRYWAFGGDWRRSEAVIAGVKSVTTSKFPIKVFAILDGDKRATSVDLYPPGDAAATTDVQYWGFWELENIFLMPTILDLAIDKVGELTGSQRFWEKAGEQKERLYASLEKTIVKNELRQYSVDRIVKDKVGDDLAEWKKQVAAYSYNAEKLKASFEQVIQDKNWQWIPGKEGLGIALDIEPNFWVKLEKVGIEELRKIFVAEASLNGIMNNLTTAIKS